MAHDVTDELLKEIEFATGSYAKTANRAAPAKVPLTKSLRELFEELLQEPDLTMGYISRPLLYSRLMGKAKRHANIIRLIKGGFISVIQSDGPPPHDTRAHREAFHSQKYYQLELNDITPQGQSFYK